MELIHCQRCGMMPQFTPEQRGRYYITSCSHLFCESCVTASPDQCSQCQRNCAVKELNAQVGSDVKALFDDPLNALKTAISKPLHALQFQRQLNRDKMRIFGKMFESLKAARAENSNLKEEVNHLRRVNEETTQNLNQMRMKVNELQIAAKRSPLPQMSAQGQGSDTMNLFRDPMDRPNAHVQPIVQHSTTPFSIARTPHSAVSVGSSQGQQIFSRGPTDGNSRIDLRHRSTTGASLLLTPAFATPSSSITNGRFDSGLRSPFLRQPSSNSSEIFRSGLSSTHTPYATPSKTPELINRLRNLKWYGNLSHRQCDHG